MQFIFPASVSAVLGGSWLRHALFAILQFMQPGKSHKKFLFSCFTNSEVFYNFVLNKTTDLSFL
jgi:hypothetical protein